MIQIIEGKRYNTETATEVADYWNGLGSDDFGHLRETLYQTPNGNWFIYGKGGARSRYAQASGNGWCGGSTLRALTPDEAYAWLEEHEETDAIETHFADRIQDA